MFVFVIRIIMEIIVQLQNVLIFFQMILMYVQEKENVYHKIIVVVI